MGALKKMEIIGYKDPGFDSKTGYTFTAMINPTIYGRKQQVRFHSGDGLDGGNAPAYQTYDDEKLSFEFVLDTTGVVPGSAEKSLPKLIKQLEDTCYTYVGDKHQPPFIQIVWGTLSYHARASLIEVEYTLFSPEAMPLRAKVKLEVLLYIDPKKREMIKKKSSPDLSHIITVVAGDTLPGLCARVYDNPAYCAEVAAINQLTGIREIEPGMELLFPPLSNN